MLDIKKVQSTNRVNITGTLSELDIEERLTRDGRQFITGTAKVRVDQEIGGEMTENEVPVRMFSMRNKSDGTENKMYDNIKQMAERFTSLAAAENPSQASRVSITGARLEENAWVDRNGEIHSGGFQISTNFMNPEREGDKEQAKFELSGVIANISEETDRNGEETGRLILKFIVVGYNGKADLITLIAQNPIAVNHIRQNWEKGDTVSLTGVINITHKVETWEEEQGFGEPITRTRTVSKSELLITGGSPSGLDEDMSYDNDSIKLALDDRMVRLNALKENRNKPAQKPKPKTSSLNDFGF